MIIPTQPNGAHGFVVRSSVVTAVRHGRQHRWSQHALHLLTHHVVHHHLPVFGPRHCREQKDNER
jgi:hypothetical protein